MVNEYKRPKLRVGAGGGIRTLLVTGQKWLRIKFLKF